jgi:hypothetical protein
MNDDDDRWNDGPIANEPAVRRHDAYLPYLAQELHSLLVIISPFS